MWLLYQLLFGLQLMIWTPHLFLHKICKGLPYQNKLWVLVHTLFWGEVLLFVWNAVLTSYMAIFWFLTIAQHARIFELVANPTSDQNIYSRNIIVWLMRGPVGLVLRKCTLPQEFQSILS